MECIGIGIDVSKGRADIAFINQSGTLLVGSGGYDDTHAGHERLRQVLSELRLRHPDARLIAGVEATAGYERSWVAFFHREQQAGRAVVIHRLNPLAVKRYLEAELHRKVDDRQAARGIARFLLERKRHAKADAIPLDGRVVLYRTIRSLMLQRTAQHQRFQTLLPATNPELVQYCDHGIPDWILAVCARYPTATHLARCHLTTLASIPHVGQTKGTVLRLAAQTSTAALTDEGTAIAMQVLVEDIQILDQRIRDGQRRLADLMADDPRVALVDSIPGIAPWSAIALVLEIGDTDRFADVRQLVAWAGLDPREDESGDGVIKRGISHRGNAHLRAILFPLAMAGMQHHPRIAEFVQKKINEGKPKKSAMVAGAAKLLRIVFAILVSKNRYDHDHETTIAKPKADAQQKARSAQPPSPAPIHTNDLTAPVSAKERKKRQDAAKKAAAQPSQTCEVGPHRERQATAPAASSPAN